MSTREIAELTDKEHKNILADVRTMFDQLGIAAAEFSATARISGPNNSTRSVEVFNLPKDLTTTLVSGYSIPMRHAIVKRWFELEATTTAAIPSDFAAALRLAATQHEALQAAAAQAAIAAPKVRVYDSVVAVQPKFCRKFPRG